MMYPFNGSPMGRSKLSARRRREFQELERKAFLGVIGASVFVIVVATLAVYFGINVHDY
jgi:hypothetical protein